MARRVRRALLPRLDWAPALCGNYGAASNHSSFCQLAPFNNTLLLCVIVFLCFEQFVIGAFILGLITATMPLFWFSMAEIGTQEDITDFGMIWMKQILISRQPGYITQQVLPTLFLLVVLWRITSSCVQNHNWTCHATAEDVTFAEKKQLELRRGCDLTRRSSFKRSFLGALNVRRTQDLQQLSSSF